MNPICYEEAVPNGTSIECAEFMATALEHYLKAVVSSIVSKVRSDLPGFSTVSGGSVITSAHANELGKGSKPLVNGVVKEIEGKRKEAEVRESKRTLGIADMKIALDVSGVGELGQMATIMEEIKNEYSEGVLEGWAYDSEDSTEGMDHEMSHAGKRPAMRPMTNGAVLGIDGHGEDGLELDDSEESWGWEGGRGSDRRHLNSLLDECLAI